MPTTTWNSNGSRSWRTSHGWRTDNTHVYQGQWSGWGLHRGLWFFNDSNIRSVLSGQNITRVRLRATRLSSGGVSGGQTPTIRVHNYSTQPAGTPAEGSGTSSHGVSWAWGETKWVTLPTWMGVQLRDGDARGIMLSTSSNSPYMIFSGSAILEITYEPAVTTPSTPTNFRYTDADQESIIWRWNAVSGAEVYELQRESTGTVVTVSTTSRRWPLSGSMLAGTIDRWRVRARNSAGVSSYTPYTIGRTIPPDPPTPTTGTRTETSIAQSVPEQPGATGYDWMRSGVIILTNGTRTPNFTGLSPDTTYGFRARSRNIDGVSGWSGTRNASTLLPLPLVPTGLQASGVSETSATVSWNASNWATTYTLRRTRLSDNQVVDTTGIGSTSQSVSDLDDGEEYRFEVAAVNSTGSSDFSGPVTIETPRIWEDPEAPTGVGPSGMVGTSRPMLTGTMSPHADGLLQRMEFQLSPSVTFEQPRDVVASSFIASGTQQVLVPGSLQLEQGHWYLRARVRDSEGGAGPWASTVDFVFSRLKVWSGDSWNPKMVHQYDGENWRTVPLWVRSLTGWR